MSYSKEEELIEEEGCRSEKRRRVENCSTFVQVRGNKLNLSSTENNTSTSNNNESISTPSFESPRLIKPLPLRPFTYHLPLRQPSPINYRSSSLATANQENHPIIPSNPYQFKTNAEVLELEVEEEEFQRFNLEKENQIKARQALSELRDDIVFDTTYIILTDKTGSNYLHLEPHSTRFDSTNGSFEWILPLNQAYYLIIIPLSSLAFIAFSPTGLTLTQREPPQLFTKPIQNPLNLPWSLTTSLPNFNTPNKKENEEIFHHLEIKNSFSSKKDFWKLVEKFPLLIDLVDCVNMESEDSSSRFCSDPLEYIDVFNHYPPSTIRAETIQSQSLPPNSSLYSQFFQPTPPPSPSCSSLFISPPLLPSFSNQSYLPLPYYPNPVSYQFPCPLPLPLPLHSSSSFPTCTRNNFQNQLSSPPCSAMARYSYKGFGLGLDIDTSSDNNCNSTSNNDLKAGKKIEVGLPVEEENWWWGF